MRVGAPAAAEPVANVDADAKGESAAVRAPSATKSFATHLAQHRAHRASGGTTASAPPAQFAPPAPLAPLGQVAVEAPPVPPHGAAPTGDRDAAAAPAIAALPIAHASLLPTGTLGAPTAHTAPVAKPAAAHVPGQPGQAQPTPGDPSANALPQAVTALLGTAGTSAAPKATTDILALAAAKPAAPPAASAAPKPAPSNTPKPDTDADADATPAPAPTANDDATAADNTPRTPLEQAVHELLAQVGDGAKHDDTDRDDSGGADQAAQLRLSIAAPSAPLPSARPVQGAAPAAPVAPSMPELQPATHAHIVLGDDANRVVMTVAIRGSAVNVSLKATDDHTAAALARNAGSLDEAMRRRGLDLEQMQTDHEPPRQRNREAPPQRQPPPDSDSTERFTLEETA